MLHKLPQVVWMDEGTPIADRDLHSLLGKAIDGGEPRRKLHTVRGEIFLRRIYLYYIPSDQRELCSKLKLPVAVGECLFRSSAFGYINVDTDHPVCRPIAVV